MKGLNALIKTSQSIITSILIPLAFALCLLYFFWGIAKYIRGAGDEKAVEEGRRIMVWGVVALFVVSSIWGIIVFIRQEFNIRNIETVQRPLNEATDSRLLDYTHPDQ
jgi:TRAP-type C4-dicarboxylate transport system permease small subunit